MAKSHFIQTNFKSGVLSPQAHGRIDVAQYNNGLKTGTNITIENPGGAARRPGTLFLNEYDQDYVRLLPFTFNTEQTYLIVMYDQNIDIYYDNVQQTTISSPYLKDEIPSIDWAQSADSMILTHGSHAPQILRRLGSHNTWELVPVPFVNAPCNPQTCVSDSDPGDIMDPTCSDESTPNCVSGKCDDDSDPTCEVDYTLTDNPVWNDTDGWPKYCTFHVGRLWLAGTDTLANTYPSL